MAIVTTDIGANSCVIEYAPAFDMEELKTGIKSKIESYGWTSDDTNSDANNQYYYCDQLNGDGSYQKGLIVSYGATAISYTICEYAGTTFSAGTEVPNSLQIQLNNTSGGYIYVFCSPHWIMLLEDDNDSTLATAGSGFFEFSRDDLSVSNSDDTHRFGKVNFETMINYHGCKNFSNSYVLPTANENYITTTSVGFSDGKSVDHNVNNRYQTIHTPLHSWGHFFAGYGHNSLSNKVGPDGLYAGAQYRYFYSAGAYWPDSYSLEPSFTITKADVGVNLGQQFSGRDAPDFKVSMGRAVGLKMVKNANVKDIIKMPVDANGQLDANGTLRDHFVVFKNPLNVGSGDQFTRLNGTVVGDAGTFGVAFAIPM